MKRTVSTADGGWLHYLWLLPAALGAAATALLCWAAWTTAWPVRWPDLYPAWWWTLLRPDQDGTLLVTAALWGASLACYAWPRRFLRLPIGLITVVAMILIGGALVTTSLVPCRGGATATGVFGWLLDIYLGQPPPPFAPGVCPGTTPLAMQLGQIVCPGATVIGALAVASVLWREPLSRLRSRFARDATVFTGLDQLTLPLLRELAGHARSPRHIIVIEPDEAHPLLDEARLTGARVIIGNPASPRLLRPIIIGLRGCALNRLYALSGKVAENEAAVAAAGRILSRYRPDSERQPHLVALIEDPRHAEAWRGSHGGTAGAWFEDALSSAESTARGLAGRVIAAGARDLVLCGDSSLALAILFELARRAWEQAELAKAAAAGRRGPPPAPWPALPVRRVLLLDPRSEDLRREYVASVPAAVLESAPEMVTEPVPWRDHLLRTLDAKDQAAARQTAVIIADGQHENGLHEGGRVARLHPETPVFVLARPGEGISQPIFGRLMPFERSLLSDGEVPEDTWTRVARHWHEYYRLCHPVQAGDPRSANRLPWAELDEFIRQDNVLQLRSVLSQVAALGRQWAPARLVPPGSFIELSHQELERVALAEHARWCRRRLAAGRPAGASWLTVPWADLPGAERAQRVADARQQLAQLEDVGFLPVVAAGGPPTAGSFERVGVVSADQLASPLGWTLPSGEQLRGDAGDWRVTDGAGNTRTVTDSEFRSSHAQLDDGRWRRVGAFRAWQVREAVVIRTKEGRATACPGDWVVEGPGGERWPVSDRQFGASYRRCQDRAATDGQASTAAAISSTTAPTIS
ncbi:MAG: hypothetical protein ABSA02_26365 [Trebonia sp.]